MNQAPTNPSLLRGVERLHTALTAGDHTAKDKLVSIASQAKDGDVTALAALTTMSIVNYERNFPEQWAKAGVMHARIVQKDPSALRWAFGVQEKAKAGDEKSRRILGMLNAHRDKGIVSAWAEPAVSGENENTRTRNVISMNLGRSSSSLALARVEARAMGRTAVGADPVAAVKKFLTLTPDAEQQLIAMMMRGASSKPAAGTSLSNVPLPAAVTASAAPPGPFPATLQELVAYKTSAFPSWGADMPSRLSAFAVALSAGRSLVNANPDMQVLASNVSRGDQEVLTGFYFGAINSLTNSLNGPGQEKAFNELLLSSEDSSTNVRRANGFRAAQAQQYNFSLSKKPIFLPKFLKLVASTGPGLTDAQRQAMMTNQTICNSAAMAKARNSPAYPGLAQSCAEARRQNILNGSYLVDDMTTDDPAFRVALTDAGEAVVSRNPKMAQFRSTLPNGSRARGFTMAMGARAGRVDPKFISFVTPGLRGDPELLKGFLDGMAM